MLEKSTYYILDAQGNQLSMYEHEVDSTNLDVTYYLAERNIYGSSRLGTVKDQINMIEPSPLPSYGILGNRNYELSNHLGNVLTVINDIVYPLSEDSNTVDGYEVGISNVFDYSPFGVQLDGRTIEQEMVPLPPDTTIIDYTSYIYQGDFENPPIVYNGTDIVSIDDWIHLSSSELSLHTTSGSQWLKVNSNKGSAGTRQGFDVESGKTYTISIDLKRNGGLVPGGPIAWGSSSTQQAATDSLSTPVSETNATNPQSAGAMSFKTPSVVNVVVWNTATASGQYSVYKMYNDGTNTFTYTANSSEICIQIRQKGIYYLDNIELSTEATDTIIEGGDVVSGGYRYGFNGVEKDDEIKGSGNSLTFTFRIYDPRLGRFLSVDPLAQYYPYSTPYAFAENDVIRAVDLEGLEKYIVTFRTFIPQPKLDNPNPFGTSSSFKGDNRKYYDVNSTAYRTEQKVSVDFDLGKAFALNNKASGTTGLDSKGNVKETSSSGKAGTIRNTKGFDENSKAITFYFKVDAKNKLVSGAPAINADISVTITPNEDGSYGYAVKGIADGFPAYEIFVTDVTDGKNESNLIFNQNPIEAGQTPWSLFGSGEFEYDYSGDSNTEQEGTKKAGKVNFSDVKNTPEKE